MPSPTMTENPFEAIRLALWRKIDDSGPGGGSELLHQWALAENPSKGLTDYRDLDQEGVGFPVEISSGESPALYIRSRASQRYDFGPGRFLDFPEQFEVVGAVVTRNGAALDRFLWLVLRALWTDYPRLLGEDGLPLPGIKAVTIRDVTREIRAGDQHVHRRFTLMVEVKFCVNLATWEVT